MPTSKQMTHTRITKFLSFYNSNKDDLFNLCMHLSKYNREDALSMLKTLLIELLSSYEKGQINGKGSTEKIVEIILSTKENTTKEDTLDLLRYKNSSTRKSHIEKLNSSINALGDSQREIIKKHYIEGVSYELIAKEINKKPGALRTMACRTMQKLKDELS